MKIIMWPIFSLNGEFLEIEFMLEVLFKYKDGKFIIVVEHLIWIFCACGTRSHDFLSDRSQLYQVQLCYLQIYFMFRLVF